MVLLLERGGAGGRAPLGNGDCGILAMSILG
jgi:hypothetical protein